MVEVDIWTASGIRGSGRQDGKGVYEVRMADGPIHRIRRRYGVRIENMTGNAAELFTLVHAAMYVNSVMGAWEGKKVNIRVHTDSGYIRSNWFLVKIWRTNGWKGRKGQDIKNVDLWQKVDELLFSKTVNPVWEESVNMEWLREAAKGE